jgi:hypothetical protein
VDGGWRFVPTALVCARSARNGAWAPAASTASSSCSSSSSSSFEGDDGVVCSQNGHLSNRGGGQNRWHSLVSCDHGDSTTSRFDSPSWSVGPARHPHPPRRAPQRTPPLPRPSSVRRRPRPLTLSSTVGARASSAGRAFLLQRGERFFVSGARRPLCSPAPPPPDDEDDATTAHSRSHSRCDSADSTAGGRARAPPPRFVPPLRRWRAGAVSARPITRRAPSQRSAAPKSSIHNIQPPRPSASSPQ